jgi:signal transduction histidine kinase/DNA-binding response OmpR family regulator
MSRRIVVVAVRHEHDVVLVRQRARQIARLVGFDASEQTRIATAVSEIVRNAFRYAGGGQVEFAIEGATAPQLLEVVVSDTGPGIGNPAHVLSGHYRSQTGMGLGLIGARRLMDQFELDSAPGRGTRVVLRKLLPTTALLVTPARLGAIAQALGREAPASPIEELQRQNQELLMALEELRRRQDELTRLNHELEDTNRGVVALYAELDEKADHLRRADELKSRFLSDMSHEFRTPLNSITALSHILLSGTDGDLGPEQTKQVSYIREAAHDLTELVNDLLDLAKVEAGKTDVRPIEFEARNLFGALRGMLRPLLVNESLNLLFEVADDVPILYTDEAKVSQILRNFVSNALKFTERGEVRVTATSADDGASVVFAVADTGVGIAPEDQERIFEEFTQLEHPLQTRVKGTGLGLPLTRRLAELLGGRVSVVSQPGVGSTFRVVLPVTYRAPLGAPAPAPVPAREWAAETEAILVIDDDLASLAIYDGYLKGTEFRTIPVRALREARRALASERPRAIILDIRLDGEETWHFLAELKRNDVTQDIPVVVISAVDDPRKGLALGAHAYGRKPVEREWLLATLRRAMAVPAPTALVIDDDAAARYLLKRELSRLAYEVVEAADGTEGLRLARHVRPQVIFLDLVMPGLSGHAVLAELKDDPGCAGIPVIVVTSEVLEPAARGSLATRAVAVLSKEGASPGIAHASLQAALARAGLVAT